ncbi:MAG: ABC transporter substrate-binding protein [Dermatophilaceae bacterium]
MNLEVVTLDSIEVAVAGPDPSVLRLGLLVPLSGSLGLTGPSALGAAALAVAEVNAGGGVRGKALEVVSLDAGRNPVDVAGLAGSLAGAGLVDAFVGFHTSDVHRAVEKALGGRTPYIFTPPHEGGSRAPGVVLMGDGPAKQLATSIEWLVQQRHVRRWALIGNDYIWPHAVHQVAGPLIQAAGGQVLLERLVPLGLAAFGLEPEEMTHQILGELARSGVDSVLLSLVGRDLARFNRAFQGSSLRSRVVRLSGALEENGLLAAGGDHTGELYAAMRSFAGQRDARREALADRYREAFGVDAPVLDAYAEGCYDGVHLVAALNAIGSLDATNATAAATHLLREPDAFDSQRAWSMAPLGAPPGEVHLARADGFNLAVVSAH